jgi:DMSO/TMAO reductase YedYZ molybdopterin-dependent catalytic subunit
MRDTRIQYWSFMLGGMVDVPLPLSYTDLLALPPIELECAILHAGRSLNGPMMHQACWQGAPVAAVLNDVSIQPGARFAQLYAANGYATSIELQALNRAVLAYQMNGEVLSAEHGYPVRLIVPGLYGYKMPRQIQRIVLADQPLVGAWEKRGWSLDGQVQVTSAIDSPLHHQTIADTIMLRGTAFAGERAIKQVEVSINDSLWMPAPFTQASPYTFARWSIDWKPSTQGDHSIKVRAIDSAGITQSDMQTILVRS